MEHKTSELQLNQTIHIIKNCNQKHAKQNRKCQNEGISALCVFLCAFTLILTKVSYVCMQHEENKTLRFVKRLGTRWSSVTEWIQRQLAAAASVCCRKMPFPFFSLLQVIQATWKKMILFILSCIYFLQQ